MLRIWRETGHNIRQDDCCSVAEALCPIAALRRLTVDVPCQNTLAHYENAALENDTRHSHEIPNGTSRSHFLTEIVELWNIGNLFFPKPT